ncbi:MAG: hypothetical protein AB1503_05145 [Bacillota bacterium]
MTLSNEDITHREEGITVHDEAGRTGERVVVDVFTQATPEQLDRVMADAADLANFIFSVSGDGKEPLKLADAIRMLLIVQEEEFATGRGVSSPQGLGRRFAEAYGREPAADPGGVVMTGVRLSLLTRDWSIQLTSKGLRLLGSLHKVLQDWFSYHRASELERTMYLSQRELELEEAYDRLGYRTNAVQRALAYLVRGYEELKRHRDEFIVQGIATEKVRSILDRYDLLADAIRQRQAEGAELGLQAMERIEMARAEAFTVLYDSLAGVVSSVAGKARAESSPISKARFYRWLVEAFSNGELLAVAREAGDLLLPVHLPAPPDWPGLLDSILEVTGRAPFSEGDVVAESGPTATEEGALDELEEAFDPGLQPFVDRVLEWIPEEGRDLESNLMHRHTRWEDKLLLAAALAEVYTRHWADFSPTGEAYERHRVKVSTDAWAYRDHAGAEGRREVAAAHDRAVAGEDRAR